MTETTAKIIHTINAVDGFNPAEFTRHLSNEDGSTSFCKRYCHAVSKSSGSSGDKDCLAIKSHLLKNSHTGTSSLFSYYRHSDSTCPFPCLIEISEIDHAEFS